MSLKGVTAVISPRRAGYSGESGLARTTAPSTPNGAPGLIKFPRGNFFGLSVGKAECSVLKGLKLHKSNLVTRRIPKKTPKGYFVSKIPASPGIDFFDRFT